MAGDITPRNHNAGSCLTRPGSAVSHGFKVSAVGSYFGPWFERNSEALLPSNRRGFNA